MTTTKKKRLTKKEKQYAQDELNYKEFFKNF